MKLSLILRRARLRAANSILLHCLTFPLFLLGSGLMLVQPCTAAPFAFENTGDLHTARWQHTATLLPNGKVLVAGGENFSDFPNTAELYDPASGTWSDTTGNHHTVRIAHTATLLSNGKVLVAGGYNPGSNVITAELYDPASGSWSATGDLHTARKQGHTATLLPNGKVLVAGGRNSSGDLLNTAELYDPASGTWNATGTLATGRVDHTATLLPNGKVLVAGGRNSSGDLLNTAELYDPASGTWCDTTGDLHTARYAHTATLLPNGKVLVAGGLDDLFDHTSNTAELYDPASGKFDTTGDLHTARYVHTATLLPNGKVLAAGGALSVITLNTAELYDPGSGTWSATGDLITERYVHTATLLPNGRVLLAGGAKITDDADGGNLFLNTPELYDPANGTFDTTGDLTTARGLHTATLLPNGKVLVAGGHHVFTLNTAELYDPASGTFDTTGALSLQQRHSHTATLLPNGKVLMAGGTYSFLGSSPLNSAQLYDPVSGTFDTTGNLHIARYVHTATLLPNGVVLVAGGIDDDIGGDSVSAELYDTTSGTWTPTGDLHTARFAHTATLLPNGKVLVAGGDANANAELYDPASGTFDTTGNLNTGRSWHTATLLPNGKVLVAGGLGDGDTLASAELYDPANGTFDTTGNLTTPRSWHTATLLPNGKVLVAGGAKDARGASIRNSAELYDPAGGTWTEIGDLHIARYVHTATLLPNGKVLVAGGGPEVNDDDESSVISAELYDVGLGFSSAWQPQIATALTLTPGSPLVLSGSLFQGISQASGGNFQDSSSNYPVVQLRSLDNSQVAFLPVDPIAGWSDTAFTSVAVTDFPSGPALVTVFTNGIPSDSKYLVLPAYAAQVQQPINPDGSSVFNVKRGVVPVTFALTQDGFATCDLPPATIAVTRTAGGTTGEIDESIYTGPADNGSNFRILGCGYTYNLSPKALGVGTYRVDITINGQVVGNATFQLK